MAREFMLFVHICHWIGGETAVPFNTSPGLLTVCHRGEMETSGHRGRRRPPRGCTDLVVHCFAYFSPQNTSTLSPLDFILQEEPPNMDMCLLKILNISVGSCTCPKQICLPMLKGNRKRKEKLWQPQCHWVVNYKGLVRTVKACLFITSISLDNRIREHITIDIGTPDSSFTSFTTCVKLWQNR